MLRDGTDIYAVNDAGTDGRYWSALSGYEPPSGATGTFFLDPRPDQPHCDDCLSGEPGVGTNNSEALRDEVLNWFATH